MLIAGRGTAGSGCESTTFSEFDDPEIESAWFFYYYAVIIAAAMEILFTAGVEYQ